MTVTDGSRNEHGEPPSPPAPGTYEGQLADVLPDTDTAERLELLGSLADADVRTVLAFVATYAAAAFDAAVESLLGPGDDKDQGDDDIEPYCSACAAAIGVFIGHGSAYLHYTGEGTVASPVELYDAGHEAVVAWRPAGARTGAGQ